MVSGAYADLGGAVTPYRSPCPVGPQHRFHPASGWCGCGLRDDGRIAEGSPAWRIKQNSKPE